MAKQLTHKKLIETGKLLGGVKIAGDIYSYENGVHYITALRKEEGRGLYDPIVDSIIDDIKKKVPNAIYCSDEKLFYSAGINGCNGNLHKISVISKNEDGSHEVAYVLYTYC